ncbi:MAG: Gfo/Idh/MocA family oxidoreductase [Acidobacteriota bacterium]|nr:Gfo/Idh/MocA family oxidoreductase [Acidobacteriota bacterium]
MIIRTKFGRSLARCAAAVALLASLAGGAWAARTRAVGPADGEDKKIRVGLVRADSHGVYFAALMDEMDPRLFNAPTAEKSPYSWMTGSYHPFFFESFDITKMTAPFVGGFDIVKVWDEHPEAARLFSKVWRGKPEVCRTYEEVSDGVDLVLIADCNYDGSDHLKLAEPGLRKGMPTFVDKPLGFEVKDARAIIELAKANDTPLYSSSILSTVPHAARFRDRIPEIGEAQFGIVRGGGPNFAGQVHAIALALHVFGGGVERVDSMGGGPLAYVHLDWGRREGRPRDGVVLNCRGGGMSTHSGFFVSAFSDRGGIHSESIDSYTYVHGAALIVEKIKDMVRTGKPPVDYDRMLEPIAVATAARLSHAERRPVTMEEVLGRK